MDQRLELISKLTNISADSIAKSPNLQQELAKAYTSLSVNLNKALSNPGSNDDLILENGDLIMVSQSSSLVKVSGEVYFPTMIPYEPGTNLKYYVKRTGNYTSKARRNQAFVIYPDGKAKAVKKFLWFKSYPKVTPRSEVFVPSKGEKIKQGLSTGEWVAISSIIATLGTLVVTVINNR
jgi:protein involved in polysaccharide export with SLBB domain